MLTAISVIALLAATDSPAQIVSALTVVTGQECDVIFTT